MLGYESRVTAMNQLKGLDPAAWTALLAQEVAAWPCRVVAVASQPMAGRPKLTRYFLTLSGHSDPITFIGKETNRTEALFYRKVAHLLPFLAPRSWFSHLGQEQGWVVMSEVYHTRPVTDWTANDVEKLLGALVALHARFWEQEEFLAWLPNYLGAGEWPYPAGMGLVPGRGAILSYHAVQCSGRLAPTLLKAMTGIKQLHALGGWPELIPPACLTAIHDLLDDPMVLFQSLRDLPVSLLHGDPAIRHWRLTLLDEQRLLDWHRPAVGPAIIDLIHFLEQIEWQRAQHPDWTRPDWPATEETMIDSYLLRMSIELGPLFPARQMRQAIPAGRCLYLLTHWLPRLTDWLQPFVDCPQQWQRLVNGQEHPLQQARPYLVGLFRRFWQAYHTL